jgi:hypothetical protein
VVLEISLIILPETFKISTMKFATGYTPAFNFDG